MKLFIGIAIFALGGCAAGATLIAGNEATEASWKAPALIASALTSGLGLAITTLAWWQGRENYTKGDGQKDRAHLTREVREAGNTASREAWTTRGALHKRADITDSKVDALAAAVNSLGISKERVFELARSVREDIENFDEAKNELQYLVRVAKVYLRGGGRGDNLDEFVRGVIEQAKAQSFHEGQITIDDALRTVERKIEAGQDQLAQQEQGRLLLLDEGIELGILARDPAAVAQKEWRKIILTNDESIRHDALRAKQDDYDRRGQSMGVALDLKIALELSQVGIRESKDDEVHATHATDRAIVLKVLGESTGGDVGLAYLKDALLSFDAALEVWTRESAAAQWAMTQQNRATVLRTLGTRTGGDAGLAYLEGALASYDAALEVRTRENAATQWAMTQQNRAGVLTSLGKRTGGDEGLAYLKDALVGYDAALEVRTRESAAAQWATTQQNRAGVLTSLGERTGGDEGLAYLKDALLGFDAALEVLTPGSAAVDWAMTQQNRANALEALGKRTGGDEGLAYLKDALSGFDAALEVVTRESAAAYWAMTQQNRAIVVYAIGVRTGGDAGLAQMEDAIAGLDAALDVRTRESAAAEWAMTTENKARVLLFRFELTKQPRDLTLAETAATDAMSVYSQGGMSHDVETCQRLLDKIARLKAGGSPNDPTPV